jgi:hypothetical protein
MLYKLATLISIIGCLLLLLFVFLTQYKGLTLPLMKPVLWITIVSLVVRILVRKRAK